MRLIDLTAEEHPPGTLVHDRNEPADEGWYIVGRHRNTYYDVDNALWIEAHPDDVHPWTDEYFESCGPVMGVARAAARVAFGWEEDPVAGDGEKRKIEPGSCLWCGHKPHVEACPSTIRTDKAEAQPCTCVRHTWVNPRVPRG